MELEKNVINGYVVIKIIGSIFVKYNDTVSEKVCKIGYFGPDGSIMDPLPIVSYINDLNNIFKQDWNIIGCL